MPLHVAHRPVPTEREPAFEPPLVGLEVGRRDPELREAEVAADLLDVGGELIELCWGWDGHDAGSLEFRAQYNRGR